MGFGWQSGTSSTPPGEATEFVEVVYGRNNVLSVRLPPDLTRDEALAEALMDVIAMCGERESAEDGIHGLARQFGLDVHPVQGRGERRLTLTRSAATGGPH